MSAAAWTFVHAPNVADPGLDSPRLSTIAAAILDIGARPTLDPRGNYLTLAKVRCGIRHLDHLPSSIAFL